MRFRALANLALTAGTLAASLVAWPVHEYAAHAAPELEIHARVELRLRPIRKDVGDTYVLSGQLVDRNTGVGIGGEPVRLEVAGQRVTAISGSDGTFEIRVRAPGGRQDVAVHYDGSSLLDPAKVELHDVDVDKNAVDLAVTTSAVAGAVEIRAEARIADAPVTLPVDLYVGPATAAADELEKVGATQTGGAPFTLTRAAAGGPGAKRVRAVFPGDEASSPAEADATVELGTATTVTLQVGATSVAFEDDARPTGTVLDEDGRPVPRAPVALLAGTRRIAQAVSDGKGVYRFRVEGSTLGEGEAALQVVVEPTEGWMRGSRSNVVSLTVRAPQPVPIAYTIAAFALTALVAGGFFAARARPWERLRRAEPGPDGERPAADAAAAPAPGLVPARPSLVSTLRRPADHAFTGVVRDAVRLRPLPGARVVLTRAGGETLVADAGADGAFAFDTLAADDWRVEVTHAGHVRERFTITLPHRGELRGARVDLMPVRERIFALYKRAALPLLPDPGRWGVWSPRQVFDHVRRRRPARALADLTDFVETAYFAAVAPDEDRLPEAEARVDAAIAEHAPVDDRSARFGV